MLVSHILVLVVSRKLVSFLAVLPVHPIFLLCSVFSAEWRYFLQLQLKTVCNYQGKLLLAEWCERRRPRCNIFVWILLLLQIHSIMYLELFIVSEFVAEYLLEKEDLGATFLYVHSSYFEFIQNLLWIGVPKWISCRKFVG